MKLAGFYGFTAPFVVIMYDRIGDEKIKEFCSLLDNDSDRENLEYARCELLYFKKALKNLPLQFTTDSEVNFTEQERLAYFDCGNVLNFDGDTMTLTAKVSRFLTMSTALSLLSDKMNCYVVLSNFEGGIRSSILARVKEFIATERFNVSELDTAIRKIVRKFINRRIQNQDKGAIADFNTQLQSEFKISAHCPKTIFVDGMQISLTDDEHKVLQYFIDRIDSIDVILSLMSTSSVKTTKLFGVPFVDILQRRPSFLLNVVARTLDAKKLTKAQFLIKVRNNMLDQLLELKRLFEERIVIKGSGTNTDFGLDLSAALEILDQMDTDVSDIAKLMEKGSICTENLKEETIFSIVDLYRFAECCTVIELNNFFRVDLTISDWESCVEHFNSLGIYGLNLYTVHLFLEFLTNSTLNLFDKILMKKQTAEDFKDVISEIEALIDSIKPIGGSVSEKLVHI